MRDLYAARGENTVQGFAYLMAMEYTGEPLYMLSQIYVQPKFRNQGVATQLLTEITEEADKNQVTLILDFQPAEFNSDATRLQLFYERFGFTWDATIGGMRRVPQ